MSGRLAQTFPASTHAGECALPRGWSFATERRVKELAAAGKSLEEAARILGRKRKTIQAAAIRLGVSFKVENAPRARPGRK